MKLMRHFFIFILALSFSFNAFARENTLLVSDWKFKLGETADAEKTNFDDSRWQAISIPHNWGWEQAQAGKGLLSRAGLVSARFEHRRAAAGQAIFPAVRGGESGG